VHSVSDDVSLYFRVSTDGGSTYKAGASDYAWVLRRNISGSSSADVTDAADSEIQLIPFGGNVGLGNAAGEVLNGFVDIFIPSGTDNNTVIQYDLSYINPVTNTIRIVGSGTYLATTAVDAFRFLFSTGNIATGEFKLYGFRA